MLDDEDALGRSGQTFPLREAYPFAAEHGLEEQAQKIKSTKITWSRGTKSGVRRGQMIGLLQANGLIDKFIDAAWYHGSTETGRKLLDWYLRVAQEYETYLATGRDHMDEEPECSQEEFTTAEPKPVYEFALEAHLRDFIAKNLNSLEPGLKLYQSENRKGVEFAIDGGRIDILAVDTKNKFVVIELKLSQGRNKTLGQILYYMGWVDQNLGNGPCRGIIVASEISDELAVAVSRVPGIAVSKYKMNFEIENIAANII